MEHAVGDYFVLDNIVYQVRKRDMCIDCAFINEDELVCHDRQCRCGPCSMLSRHDSTPVSFIKVGEVGKPFVFPKE